MVTAPTDDLITWMINEFVMDATWKTDCNKERFKFTFSINCLANIISHETGTNITIREIARKLQERVDASARQGFAGIESKWLRTGSVYRTDNADNSDSKLTFEFQKITYVWEEDPLRASSVKIHPTRIFS